jgi:hypothetical protein
MQTPQIADEFSKSLMVAVTDASAVRSEARICRMLQMALKVQEMLQNDCNELFYLALYLCDAINSTFL